MKARRIGARERAFVPPIRGGRWCILALQAAMALAVAGMLYAQAPSPTAAANPTVGAHPEVRATGQPAKPKDASPTASTIVEQRRQQIHSECADLLKMATELKASVDKTTKDELSVTVVRQAGRIEKLARKVKDQMQPAVRKH